MRNIDERVAPPHNAPKIIIGMFPSTSATTGATIVASLQNRLQMPYAVELNIGGNKKALTMKFMLKAELIPNLAANTIKGIAEGYLEPKII